MVPLPTEILILILSILSSSKHELVQCSLVNKAFHHAASQLLYAKVIYAPAFRAILNLRDKGEIPASIYHECERSAVIDDFQQQNSQLWSALLGRNADFVHELVIGGFLSTKPISLSTFSVKLAGFVKRLPNLSSLVLIPDNYCDHVFVPLFEALLSLGLDEQDEDTEQTEVSESWTFPPLRSIKVNHSCTDDKTAPLLIQLIQTASPKLCTLTVQSPSRAGLNLLPNCLAGNRLAEGEEANQSTLTFPALRGLHFEDNCGSITPGVLAGIVSPAYIQSNLKEFTLGLSYSLTHDDVLKALSQLQRLEKLQLQYYLQYKPFTIRPRLRDLTSFTAIHEPISTRSQAQAFCKWTRTIIHHAPLEILRLVQDGDEEARDDEDDGGRYLPEWGSGLAFDSLIEHLLAKHHRTLTVLDMRHAYVGVKAARRLMLNCNNLKVLRIAVKLQIVVNLSSSPFGLSALMKGLFAQHTFCEIAIDKLHDLREVGFEMRYRKHTKKSKLEDEGLAKRVFEEGPRKLEVVWLDGVRFRRKMCFQT